MGTLLRDLSCIAHRVGNNYQKTKSTELNVVLPAERTKFMKKSVIYRGPARTYNQLPDSAMQILSTIQEDVEDFYSVILLYSIFLK